MTDLSGLTDRERETFERLAEEYEGVPLGDLFESVLENAEKYGED